MHYCCFARGGRIYEWTDGEPWVRALPWNLRGTYSWAEEAPPQPPKPTQH